MATLPKNIRRLSLQDRAFAALEAAVDKAIEEHARAGRSVYVAKKGKVVEIPPEAVLVAKRERLPKGTVSKRR